MLLPVLTTIGVGQGRPSVENAHWTSPGASCSDEVDEPPSVCTGVYWLPLADGAWTVTRLFCWSPTSTPA